MNLFYRLYNFTYWPTQNLEEAEDLVQKTYAKTFKVFSLSSLAPTAAPGFAGFAATRFHLPQKVETESSQSRKTEPSAQGALRRCFH